MKHWFLFHAAGALPARTRFLAAFLAVAAPLLLASSAAQAQQGDNARTALRAAFAEGDARAVLDHAAERIEVGLPQGSSQYSRSQAVYVLAQFFENHPPRRFAWESASSSGGSRFLTGRYWSGAMAEDAAPLRVTVRFSQPADARWQLHEVRVKQP